MLQEKAKAAYSSKGIDRNLALGTIYNMSSKLIYLICGYGVLVMVGRSLGPHELGVFGVAFSTLNVAFLFLKNGVPQAAARRIGGDWNKARPVFRRALQIQLFLGLFLFGVFFGGAGIIASSILKDAGLAPLLRLASLTILPMALYNALSGVLLGIRSFGKEAFAAAVTSVVRMAFVVLAIVLGFAVPGTIVAYALAASFGALFLVSSCRFEDSEYRVTFSDLVSFSIPLIASGVMVTLLLNMDSVMVKRIIGTDEQVGIYFAAASAAHAFYQIFAALGATLLPSIAGSYERRDMVLTRKYIHQAVRYSTALSLPVAAIVSGASNELMALFYGEAFAAAGTPLAMLILGGPFFILGHNTIMCITALGRPWISTLFYALGVGAAAVLALRLVPLYGISGAGIAMITAYFLCLLLALTYLQRCFAGIIGWLSLMRFLVSAAIVYTTSTCISIKGVMLAPWSLVLLCLYGFLIWASGEWKREDSDVLKGIVGRIRLSFPL